ncbi:SDR family NAD(P)-dependent oxidoreductase [Vibrio sp. D420a]|uniref:SDR family NAD(P)-dependent oxidoreductase n=1 Tax=Vibrio sp. D420a TaxID=2836895 RepID=UPI0025572FAA|nr:SDR family NAD(P)-dependent oxidoreductase [Vibrio sp. D420a]MDK9764724.1 SDR family NAD(P)-dependent oxidoreductase [Vibrio sp. D420a]
MARRNTHWCSIEDLAKGLFGKVYVVTGANSGVGFETAKQLIKQGAHVIMACRRKTAAEQAALAFQNLIGTYEIVDCDLADENSVKQCVKKLSQTYTPIDGLVCNAGAVIMGNQAQYSKQGHELTLATSFLGHFLLIEQLLSAGKFNHSARIAILSSVVHANKPSKRTDINFDDLNWTTRSYNAFDAYSEAKLANTLYARELATRLENTNITVASIHPGWARSNFGRGGGKWMDMLFTILRPLTWHMSDSNWASAQTSLHVLLSDTVPDYSGAYFSQSSVLYQDKECRNGGWPMKSPNPNANDLDKAIRLVSAARDLVQLNQ